MKGRHGFDRGPKLRPAPVRFLTSSEFPIGLSWLFIKRTLQLKYVLVNRFLKEFDVQRKRLEVVARQRFKNQCQEDSAGRQERSQMDHLQGKDSLRQPLGAGG